MRFSQPRRAGCAGCAGFDSYEECAKMEGERPSAGGPIEPGGPDMWYYNADHPLRRYFAGLTEQTFMDALGVADPGLVDYLSLLLSRFVHIDALHRLHADSGKTLEEVADMLMEAEAMPPGRTSREVHRHIGDY